MRDRLEKAYTEFKAGRGPTYPIISIGDDGDTVSLKAMQQISKTGIKRNVVRETTGPDRAAVWYYGSPKRCAGDEVAFRRRGMRPAGRGLRGVPERRRGDHQH